VPVGDCAGCAALPARKTFNRSIFNTHVSPHFITLIKKSYSYSEREQTVEPDSAGAKANLNLILVHFSIEKNKKYISCFNLGGGGGASKK
jgi:hypothetical protein